MALSFCHILHPSALTNLQRQIDEVRERVDEFELSEDIRVLFNLPEGSTLDDLYSNIYARFRMIMLNQALVTIKVQTINGNAFSNIPISGLTSDDGSPVYTNQNGIAQGFASDGSQTFSISGYADIIDKSQTVKIVKGETYVYSWTVSTRNYLSLDATQNMKFSANINTLNVSITGPGAPGSYAASSTVGSNKYCAGDGGNGGQSLIVDGISFTPNTVYQCSVAGSGGNSSFNGYTAYGGSSYTGNGVGGKITRNAQSGIFSSSVSGTNGTEYRYSAYNTKSLCGGGGGSGAMGNNSTGTWVSAGSGGSPYGGGGGMAMASYNTASAEDGNNASGYAGGGGGFGYADSRDGEQSSRGTAGAGGKGNIAFSMELKIQ